MAIQTIRSHKFYNGGLFVDVTCTFSSSETEPARTTQLGDQETVIHLFYSRHLITNKLYNQTSALESGLTNRRVFVPVTVVIYLLVQVIEIEPSYIHEFTVKPQGGTRGSK